MKAHLFHNLRQSALALLLAACVLAVTAATPTRPATAALAVGQTITPASNCSGSTCG
ncbi:MAG: hypothetical protein KDI03_16555 [Anaerolineae bacterium]|nr:hypothetical protein [Anaerolineae bacterium]MCB0256158.1 hypothetical protein [Anaerolineae bacterium]